jgi:hypothetical protein
VGRPRYAPAQRCEWLVEPLGAESIEAWLVAVELEDGHDFLKETPARPANASAALRCLCAVPIPGPVLARALTPTGATSAPGLATSFIPRCHAIVQGARRRGDDRHAGLRRRGGARRSAAAVGDGLGDADGARAQHRAAAAGRVHERRGRRRVSQRPRPCLRHTRAARRQAPVDSQVVEGYGAALKYRCAGLGCTALAIAAANGANTACTPPNR